MNFRLTRASLSIAIVASLVPSVTSAQVTAESAAAGVPVANSAALMIRDALAAKKAEREAARAAASARRQSSYAPLPYTPANATAASPAPASGAAAPAPAARAGGLRAGDFQELTDIKPGFEHPNSPGFAYSVELSSTLPYGKTDFPRNNLKGGFNAQVYIAPEKYTRLFAGHFSLDNYPVGFDTGVVPAYISNATLRSGPTGRTNCLDVGLGGIETCPGHLHTFLQDVSTQDRIEIVSLQKIIYVAGLFPIVISPTYLSQRGSVAGSDDRFLAWDPDRGTYHSLNVRTSQKKSVFLSLPFAASTKLFGVLTAGPSWNVNTTGNNQGNSAQIFEVLDLRYFATPTTTIFLQPSRLPSYQPVDPYPQNLATFIFGFNKKIGGPKSPFYAQGFVFSATPTNPPYGHTGRLGVIDDTCVAPPATFQLLCSRYATIDPRSNTATLFGGTKATSVNLSVGFGTPSVIPI